MRHGDDFEGRAVPDEVGSYIRARACAASDPS